MENNVDEAPKEDKISTEVVVTDTPVNLETEITSSPLRASGKSLILENMNDGETDVEGLVNLEENTMGWKMSLEKANEAEDFEKLQLERKILKREEKQKKQEEFSKAVEDYDNRTLPPTESESKQHSLIEAESELSLKLSRLETQSEVDLKGSLLEDQSDLSLNRSHVETQSQLDLKRWEEQIHEKMDDTDDVLSTSSEEADYERPMCSVNFKDKFLEFFTLPSFSDISIGSSEEQVPQGSTVKTQSEIVVEDAGTYVDPVTGEAVSSTVKHDEDEAAIAAAAAAAIEQEEEVEEETSSASIEFDWPFDLEDEVVPEAVPAGEVEFNMDLLFEINAPVAEKVVESTTEMKHIRLQREVRQLTIDFLFQLFDDVVKASEYIDPLKVLQGKFSNEKMVAQIRDLMLEYSCVKKYNSELSNKMHEYYRRSGQLRGFNALPYEVAVREYRRYKEALERLDFLREQIFLTKKKNRCLLESVKMDLEHEESVSFAVDTNLENLIRRTIVRKDDEFLPRIVERELRLMNKLRNEISDFRLVLITRHHTLGSLIARKQSFDQISADLTIDDFLVVQRELGSLGTKVEERNNDLCRIRARCSKQIQQISHIREKTSMNKAKLVTYQETLDEKKALHAKLRAKVLKLKYQSTTLKKQRNDWQQKAEMLNRPALLFDFDATVDLIQVKRQSVQRQKKILSDLETRIATYERGASCQLAESMLTLT